MVNSRLITIGLSLFATVAFAGAGRAAPWGDQGDGTFRNPILPADYSDIDAIGVGQDFYAISSTFQYSPGMVILHSTDLVHWRILGHAVGDLTQISREMNWDRMNRTGRGVWAGSLRFHGGKFWLYFGTPDDGYFMTTARNPAGPWDPLACVMKASGWDDCCPFWDDDGQGYLVGTRFAADSGNGKRYNIHLFKLASDGKTLVSGFDKILYQSQGSEANKLYKWNGLYYHFFSEVHREGRVTMIRRSATLTGPAEIHQLNHVNKTVNREPNQGGIVQTAAGDWWFVTHQGAGAWEGRTLCLLPVTWRDGWPIIGQPGADGIGNMVWQAKKPLADQPVVLPQTSDTFDGPTLGPQWEWNYQPRAEKWSLTARPGWLRLQAFHPLERGNLLKAGNTVTQRTFAADGEATVKLDVAHMADGQAAGLCHYSGKYAWIGVTQSGGARRIAFSDNGKLTPGPAVEGPLVWLRSLISGEGSTTWAYSFNGRDFTPFGGRFRFAWANYRGDRIGIFTYNDDADAGFVNVDEFQYTFTGPKQQDKK